MKIKVTEAQVKRLSLLKEEEEAILGPPVPGSLKVNSKFSKKRCLSGQKCRAHNGTDYKASSGTQAFAIADGEVVKTHDNKGACGGTIVVKHDNGYKSSYCHMSRINVRSGRVTKGQLLGNTGGKRGEAGAGNSLGAHLHFGLKYNGKWVDPEQHIDKTNIIAGGVEGPVKPKGVLLFRGDGLDGAISPDVAQMQRKLVERGYMLPKFGVDGKFGPETEETVMMFQDHYMLDLKDTPQYGGYTEEMVKKLNEPENINLEPEKNSAKSIKDNAKEGNLKPFDPVVIQAITDSSNTNGVDIGLMMTIANIESGGNPTAKNKKSNASGLYQILPKYLESYGLDKQTVWDPQLNADAAGRKLKEKVIELSSFLSRTPENYEVYMSHNQGTLGFKVIYTACKNNPNIFHEAKSKEALRNAAVQLGYKAKVGSKIFKNMKGNKGATPCEFINSWKGIYDSKQMTAS